jgi:hypothetical protein
MGIHCAAGKAVPVAERTRQARAGQAAMAEHPVVGAVVEVQAQQAASAVGVLAEK